jgi:hypothetical protein
MKTIGIVGSRRRNKREDFEACCEALHKIFKEGDRLVSGGCPQGGDHFAEIIAKKAGLTITIHYPNWEKYGKSAGFKRNTNIAEDCDVLIAIVAEDRKGGTEDTIKKAEKLGKEIIFVE